MESIHNFTACKFLNIYRRIPDFKAAFETPDVVHAYNLKGMRN